MMHWRPPHINAVQFAKLDSYDIRGLPAMISRNVPNDRIRYIVGATVEGRRASPGFLPNGYLALIMFSSIAMNGKTLAPVESSSR